MNNTFFFIPLSLAAKYEFSNISKLGLLALYSSKRPRTVLKIVPIIICSKYFSFFDWLKSAG